MHHLQFSFFCVYVCMYVCMFVYFLFDCADWAIGMGMVRQQRTRKFADQQTRIRDADTLLKAVAQKAVGTREQTVDAFKVNCNRSAFY